MYRILIYNVVEELKLTNDFIFSGMIPYEDVPGYINAFDICTILKKADVLGSPLKLWEYMACGKPVIASNTQKFKVLKECNAGILVNPENPVELANVIITLLNNTELSKPMGTKARKYVVENHSWVAVAKTVEGVCIDAICEGNGNA